MVILLGRWLTVSTFVSFFHTGGWTWGFAHVRQALYHSPTSSEVNFLLNAVRKSQPPKANCQIVLFCENIIEFYDIRNK